MSQPAGPPPYDAIYSQGVQTQPVMAQPQAVLTQTQTQVLFVPHQTHVVHATTGMSVENSVTSTVVVCRSCGHMIATRIDVRPAMRTHMCALMCCLCGLWPCCIIPYCLPTCNNVDHHCPQCNTYLGSYRG